jgi:threonine/homoserine/homoserine lactone efflux protein
MVILALIPGPGILVVVTRSITAGFRHGVSTALGIVAGDFIFITIALLGLTALSEAMGNLFFIIQYLGAAYLIGFGISIIFYKLDNLKAQPRLSTSHLASFSAGLLITLSNPKAILFYASIFPAFISLSKVTILEAVILYTLATVSVGGVMLGYAYLSCNAKSLYQFSGNTPYLRYGSGALFIVTGLFVTMNG